MAQIKPGVVYGKDYEALLTACKDGAYALPAVNVVGTNSVNAVLEAAACGVPAITSDIGGLPEVNEHNKTGNVIKPNDPKALAKSIIKFYNNPVYRKKFGQNARNRVVTKFDWENSVEKMINIYNKFV